MGATRQDGLAAGTGNSNWRAGELGRCPKCQPQQDKINKDMRHAWVVWLRRGAHCPLPTANCQLPVQLIIQVKIFISCDTYKISQVLAAGMASPIRQLLTLPQMTAPKMAWEVGVAQWRCCALFAVANLWLQIVLHPATGQKG